MAKKIDQLGPPEVFDDLSDVTLPDREALESLSKADLFEHLQLVDGIFTQINDDENVKMMSHLSGEKSTNRLLVAFLYMMMRDVVTPGSIERIILALQDRNDTTGTSGLKLTNGWLAGYAEYTADRLLHNWISKKNGPAATEGTHAASQMWKRGRNVD